MTMTIRSDIRGVLSAAPRTPEQIAEQLKQPVTVTLPLGVVLNITSNDDSIFVEPAAFLSIAGLPEVGHPWQNGTFAGLSLENGRPVALVLLPGELESGKWQNAIAWAEKQDGELPSRIDQLVLLKNLKSEFKEAWYWSAEQLASGPEFAWGQYFDDGYQNFLHKVTSFRARAVRRYKI
jgi:hypothetical protein